MSNYWDERYIKGGTIWGKSPSLSAKLATKIFNNESVTTVLVPGSGYGRHTDFFFKEGMNVDGIEISKEAIKMARDDNSKIQYYHGSVLDMPFSDEKYNGIYCFNVLHLFMLKDRRLFINKCQEVLNHGGIAFFTVFSDKEESYGKGQQIEKNTFESKKGRPVHYFTETDIRQHFNKFELIVTGLIDEPENHGDQGEHIHKLRYICVRKT